jgi:hypothetical protein
MDPILSYLITNYAHSITYIMYTFWYIKLSISNGNSNTFELIREDYLFIRFERSLFNTEMRRGFRGFSLKSFLDTNVYFSN